MEAIVSYDIFAVVYHAFKQEMCSLVVLYGRGIDSFGPPRPDLDTGPLMGQIEMQQQQWGKWCQRPAGG